MLRRLAGAALAATFVCAARAANPRLRAYMSRSCGCCGEWLKHLRVNGFQADAQYVDDVTATKRSHGVPQELWSCHTALVSGYLIEGHVPAADIVRLLRERPLIDGLPARGLAVAGMPAGSPGMEQGRAEPYATIAFGRNGSRVFARH